MTDLELVEASRRGDTEAFGALIERYQRMVEGIAYAYAGRRGAVIDDVVQDTFITAWRTIDSLRDAARVRPWLGGIAKNLACNTRRKWSRTVPDSTATTDTSVATPFDALRDAELHREVTKALGRLPARYRQPLVLFYYEQCTVKEVADALGMREDAVMQRLTRGRRQLGEALATHVELTFEKKKSRAALAACVVALLPARAVSAAPVAAATSTISLAAIGASLTASIRTAVARIVAHWRFAGAVLGCAAALAIVTAATEHSRAVAAKNAPARVDTSTSTTSTKPPSLPKGLADVDDDGIHRNMAIAALDPYVTCRRAASGLVIGTFGRDAYWIENDVTHFEPSDELRAMIDRVSTKAGEACEGMGDWPEIYVICEGTKAEIFDGNISCYPYDPFAQ